MKRRILSIVICLVVAFAVYGVVPAQVRAETDREANPIPEGLNYTIVDEQVTIVNYTGDASVLAIPSVIEGYPVTHIGASAFYNCSRLTSLTIPDSVTVIAPGAIYGCSNLESIAIPFVGDCRKNEKDMNQYPFGYIFGSEAYDGSVAVNQTNSTYYIPSKLKTVAVSNGYILKGAFYNCSGITNIILGNGVSGVMEDAFYGCSSLQFNIFDNARYLGNLENPYYALIKANDSSIASCKIHENTKLIAGAAFENCSELLGITIPNTVITIGELAFSGCKKITDVTISKGVVNIGDYAFANCSQIKNISIPESVTGIGHSAFTGCSNLTGVVIPDSVKTIGIGAFSKCTGLVEVTLSNNITSIEGDTFYGCENLTNVNIPDKVTTIGGSAFYGCRSLKCADIPNGVISIGSFAFYNCDSLTQVVIPDSVTYMADCAFHHCDNIRSVIIGNGISFIPPDAFSGCAKLENVTMGNGVTHIGKSAFPLLENLYISDLAAWCSITRDDAVSTNNLYLDGKLVTDLVIPDGVTGISNYAFYGYKSLTSVTIPDSVGSVGWSTFQECTNLTCVTIDGGASFRGGVFYGCTALEGVYINDMNTWWECYFESSSDNPLWYAGKLYVGGELITNVIVPADVSGISNYAFAGSSSLKSITIPRTVTSIGTGAFDNCTSLTDAIIEAEVTSIPVAMFRNCISLRNVTISYGVWIIGECAFIDCINLQNITLPDSVTVIQKSAFYGCSNLENIHLSNGLCYIYENAFYGCSSLKNIEIPASVTNIDTYAFDGCNSLQGIWVDADNAYYSSDTRGVLFNKDKTRLHTAPGAIRGMYTIPDGTVYINTSAFRNCANLTAVVIPTSITRIYEYAFYHCDNLTDVYYTGTKAQWDTIAIDSYNNSLLGANLTVNYLSSCNCVYGDWIVTTQPTLTMEGQQYKTCLLCGDKVTEAIPIPMSSVYWWNISLEDDLKVKFYLQINPSIANAARVRIYVGETAVTYLVSQLEQTPEGLYIAVIDVAAAQMTDQIFITVRSGNYISETKAYTVEQYAYTILADENYSQYHQLVKEMLNYGAAAQVYFDYESGNLANSGITDAGSVEIPDSVDNAVSVDGNANGTAFYGASLIFRDRIAVRYYFSFEGKINNLVFTANGQQYAPQLKDGLYYIELADIMPQNLDQPITLSVTDAEGNVLSVSYNPMNYIVRMNEKGSAQLQNLVKALYNYHLAAKAVAI